MPDPIQVRAMFGRIAGRYDLLNRLLSAGIDRRWRRRTRRRVGDVRGKVVVDSCCGTGDLALEFASAGARVLGVDFTPQMVTLARAKGPGAGELFTIGDALALPVRAGVADACTVSFGIRNTADRVRCMREMARVVKPGGRVLILEFSQPHNALMAWGYRLYFTRILPRVGGWVSGDAPAYRYLPDTVLAWPSPHELQAEMEAIGLEDCGFELLTGGIACLSYGRVPMEGT